MSTEHQIHEAQEMRIHARSLASRVADDPLVEQARSVASGILGIYSGDWTWPGLCADSIKSAAVVGCYVALKRAKETTQHPAACGPRCRSRHTDDHSECAQSDGEDGAR